MTMSVASVNGATIAKANGVDTTENNGTKWDGAVDGVNTGLEIIGDFTDLKGDFAEIKEHIKEGQFGEVKGDFTDLKDDAKNTYDDVKSIVSIAKNLAEATNDPLMKKELDKYLEDGKIDKNELALILTGLAKSCTEEAIKEDPKGYAETAGDTLKDIVEDKVGQAKEDIKEGATWLYDNTIGRFF